MNIHAPGEGASSTRMEVFHFLAWLMPACASQRLGSQRRGTSSPRHRLHPHTIWLLPVK